MTEAAEVTEATAMPAEDVAAKEQKARVLDQLMQALEAYPDKDQLWEGSDQEFVLYRFGFGGRDWIYHSGDEGWAWFPRGSPLIILAPARDFYPARWFRDEARRRERVAVARELAAVFANTFPREIIVQIYLEVFWIA